MNNTQDKNKIAVMFKLEELRADSYAYEPYSILPDNPDVIVQKKGDLSIYDKMKRDDQIKSVLWIKKFMILSTGWNINTQIDGQDKIVEFIKQNLKDLNDPDFGDVLVNILSCLDYGFSITEPVFKVGKDNKVVIDKLKTRAPHTFSFNIDKFGHIESITQTTADTDINIKYDKIMHLTYQSDFQNPYGTSDLQSSYKAWFSKDIIIRFWNIYLERFGNPHVIATVPANLKSSEKDNIMDVLKTLQARTGIRVPEGVDLKLLFPPSGNTDFERAIDKYNMMISRSMLVPDLIGIGGKETTGGSYALGDKHFELFYLVISKIKKDLERLINRKVIQPLCFWNFGIKDKFPEWRLNTVSKSDKNELLKIWVEAIKGKIWKASDEEINYFRRETNFPESDKIERVQESKTSPMPFSDEKTAKKHIVQLSRNKTEYESKIDFNKIDNDLNMFTDQAYRLFIPVFMKIKEGVLNMVISKKLIEKTKVDQINDIKIKFLKELQIAFRQVLRDVYKAGFKSAEKELSVVKMAGNFVELFEKTIEERSFYLTGIESDHITKQVKQILLDGMEKGLSIDEIVFELEEFFDSNYSWIEQNIKPSARLETIVRTNTIKAYNFGRRRFFESPEAGNFVKAYQFSAILDARTSQLCRTLDEKIYKINDPYINSITPPVHFNCRSVLIPIVEGEKYKISPKINLDKYPNFGGTRKK